MSENFNDKQTVFITGGTSGIGFGLAKAYLQAGHRVIITGRSEDRLNKAKESLNIYSNFLEGVLLDVTDKVTMKKYLLEVDKKYRIDTVIANAGVSSGVSDINDMADLAENIFSTNVYGVFNTVHPLISMMKDRKRGHIVLISSMSAFFGLTTAVFYSSSKAAIKSYGEGLRILLSDYNIDVTTVFPGFVESNITRSNKFKMPFFMDTNKAVAIIMKGLQKRKGYILFPLQMRLVVYFISILPFVLREVILKKLPRK